MLETILLGAILIVGAVGICAMAALMYVLVRVIFAIAL